MQSESLALPSSEAGYPLSSLSAYLLSRHAQCANELKKVLDGSAWAVNEEMVLDTEVEETMLKNGDVVAVIPPVSGG